MKKKVKITNKIINIIYGLSILVLLWIILHVFFIASFRITSNSMEPTLIKGDYILVWKPTVGPRLFNVYSSMKNEKVKIYRTPGIRKIRRNDVLVFNSPYPPNQWDKIEMHILRYYVKRCLALPGDTFFIENGIYRVNNSDSSIGNLESQKKMAAYEKERIPRELFYTYPYDNDSTTSWNIKEFGPLYVPRKGDIVAMDRTHFLLYQKIIEWEQNATLRYQDSKVFLDSTPLEYYCFEKDYYFMGGDNCFNSEDSRFWGLLPKDHIAGKASIIWKSVNLEANYFRWNRFLKRID